MRIGTGARRVLTVAVVAAVGAGVAFALGWSVMGGRLLVMETGSMCPTVCVGSLVADRPLSGPVRVGDLLTFHPPGDVVETYTHTVVHIFANGMIETKGVANPHHDPWLITRSDVVGRAVFTMRLAGWLYKALPVLVVGLVAWAFIRPLVQEPTRWSWDRTWFTGLLLIPVWTLHPLMGGAVVSSTQVPGHPGWVRDTVVNTGLLPASFRAGAGRGAHSVHVGTSMIAAVQGPVSAGGRLVVHQAVSMPPWGWVVLVSVVLSPLIGYVCHMWTVVRRSPRPSWG